MTYIAYADGSYRLVVGWVNAVQVTSNYELTRLPKQTDQGRSKWLIPLEDSGVYSKWAETPRALSGVARGQGQSFFKWVLGGLTPSMVDYWENTLFEGKASQQFTLMTWDRTGRWRVVQVFGYWDPPGDAGEIGYKSGYKKWTVPFVVIREAPEGPDLIPESDHGGNPVPEDMDFTYALNVSNQGDGDTFDDVLLQIDLPPEFIYVSSTGVAWDREYFESGVWVTTVTIPANVTKIRGTYSQIVIAGQDSSVMEITVNPTEIGTYNVSVFTSTNGDIDNGNDSILVETEVV